MSTKPEGMTEEHFIYLDDLRESGVTNMYGGGAYLAEEFDIPKRDASKYLVHWMETFTDRHPPKGEAK
jgi:hypothetical protein